MLSASLNKTFPSNRGYGPSRVGGGDVGLLGTWYVDGGVWPGIHPIHAGIRSGRHDFQHARLRHHVLHSQDLHQGTFTRNGILPVRVEGDFEGCIVMNRGF